MTILHTASTIGELIRRALQRYPDRIAFIHGDRRLRYSEAAEAISRAGQYLTALGVKPGDTVLQLARNTPEQWYVMAACYLAGYKSVTLQPSAASIEVQSALIQHSEAVIVLYDRSFSSRIAELRQRCADTLRWRCHDFQDPTSDGFWSKASAYEPQPLRDDASAETVVRLGFTSGTTTGHPKGVLLSSRALAAMTLISLADCDWPETIRVLCAEPIAGGFGNMIVPTLLRGGTFILLDSHDNDSYIEAVAHHQPTVALLMPPSLNALLSHPRTEVADWSSLRLMIYSGAVLCAQAMSRALGIFGPILCQVYGQTECPKSLAVLNKADHSRSDGSILQSLGIPCSGMDIAILDESLSRLGPNQIGELCARGPAVMSGYWKAPEDTEGALRGDWLHTGDLCYFDERGYLHFVDRTVDVIRRPDRLVYPSLMERELCTLPGVSSCAVIGVGSGTPEPDSAAAFIVLGGDTPEARGAVIAATRSLPIGPDFIVFVSRLPFSWIGRVVRPALRRQWAQIDNSDKIRITELTAV